MSNLFSSHNTYITVIIFFFLVVLFFGLKLLNSVKKENRLSNYAISSLNITEDSLVDKITKLIWKLIQKLSKILNKINLLKKYGGYYDKYILFEDLDLKKGIDYVALKICIGVLLVVLYFISLLVKTSSFSVISIFIAFLLGFLLPDLFLKIRYDRKRKKVAQDLLKAIMLMNSSFKTGGNIMQAVLLVRDEMSGDISDEFAKIYMDLTYGLSVEVVFRRFYERVKLDDALYISSSISLLNKTGGNIVMVFSSIERNFYDKKKIDNELKAMTSSSVFVYRTLIVFPFIFCMLIVLLNPQYFLPLFTNAIGIIILVLMVVLYISYILIIKRILKVDFWYEKYVISKKNIWKKDFKKTRRKGFAFR